MHFMGSCGWSCTHFLIWQCVTHVRWSHQRGDPPKPVYSLWQHSEIELFITQEMLQVLVNTSGYNGENTAWHWEHTATSMTKTSSAVSITLRGTSHFCMDVYVCKSNAHLDWMRQSTVPAVPLPSCPSTWPHSPPSSGIRQTVCVWSCGESSPGEGGRGGSGGPDSTSYAHQRRMRWSWLPTLIVIESEKGSTYAGKV